MQYVGGFLYIGVRAKASYLCSHLPSLPATSTAHDSSTFITALLPSSAGGGGGGGGGGGIVSFTLSVSIKEKARCKKVSHSLATDGSPGGGLRGGWRAGVMFRVCHELVHDVAATGAATGRSEVGAEGGQRAKAHGGEREQQVTHVGAA